MTKTAEKPKLTEEQKAKKLATRTTNDKTALHYYSGMNIRQAQHITTKHTGKQTGMSFKQREEKMILVIPIAVPTTIGANRHRAIIEFIKEPSKTLYQDRERKKAHTAYNRLATEDPKHLETVGLTEALEGEIVFSVEAQDPRAPAQPWKEIPLKCYLLHTNLKSFGKICNKAKGICASMSLKISGAYYNQDLLLKEISKRTRAEISVLHLGDLLMLAETNMTSEETYKKGLATEQENDKLKKQHSLEKRRLNKEAKLLQKVREQQRKINSKLAPEDYAHMFEEDTPPHQTMLGFL